MKPITIMEVTTFNINPDADAVLFSQLDAQVEERFTSKQPGFIQRQSGVNEEGAYVVVVYWESTGAADASMAKFMQDSTVADYAQMIAGPTMKMARYAMESPFNAKDAQFVEIMSFAVQSGTDMDNFAVLNKRVETEFTGARTGFLQRLVGANEAGTQVVAVYWDNKENSDASLDPFMQAPIAKEFMAPMDQATINMGRYSFLNR